MPVPLPFVWPYFPVFWAVFIWFLIPELRLFQRTARTAPEATADRGSKNVILIGFNLAILSAFLLPSCAPWAPLPGHRTLWFAAGVAAFAAGTLLRHHCFRVLGAFFLGTVQIQAEHRVIEAGAYRWVRHPSYSAGILIILGIAMAVGNWLGLAVSFAIVLGVYAYRVPVEERALLLALGAPYAKFLATRKRFIPYLF